MKEVYMRGKVYNLHIKKTAKVLKDALYCHFYFFSAPLHLKQQAKDSKLTESKCKHDRVI